MGKYKNGDIDNFWRDQGEILFFRDLRKAAAYSRHLEFAAPRVYRTANKVIQQPNAFDELAGLPGFSLARIKHRVEAEPGHFHIFVSHCEGHVCVFGTEFVPYEQDARSVLGERMALVKELSSYWIRHCSDWAKHGEPTIY